MIGFIRIIDPCAAFCHPQSQCLLRETGIMQHQSDEPRDTKIIKKIIAGDINAFEILLERYRAYVFSIVRKHIPAEHADEIAHEVFIRVYQGLPGFSGKSDFKQWLAGISVRTCYDFWRKKYRSKEISMSSLSETHREWLENTIADDAVMTFAEKKRQAEALEILDWALNKLSAADRMTLELVYLEGYSHKETSALTGWSIANVKIRAHRAKKKIYKILMAEKKKIRGPL